MTGTRARKAQPETSSSIDPNIAQENRTFELVYRDVLAEQVIETRYRIRIAKGGAEDAVYALGNDEGLPAYVGLVSERKANGHWGPYTWGHLPAPASMVKEIFPSLEKPPKDTAEAPAPEKTS